LPPTWKPQDTFLVPPAVTSLVCHMPAPWTARPAGKVMMVFIW